MGLATITFDAHQFIKTLQEAGFEESQAEAVAQAFKETQQEAEVATKADGAQLRYELQEQEMRLIKWMVGIAAAQIALLVGILVKLL